MFRTSARTLPPTAGRAHRYGTLRCAVVASLVFAFAATLVSAAPQTASIPTPEDFFGFAMGTDEKLARWDRILEYFDLVARTSDRVRVDDYGPSTLGNRFVSVVRRAARGSADTRFDVCDGVSSAGGDPCESRP